MTPKHTLFRTALLAVATVAFAGRASAQTDLTAVVRAGNAATNWLEGATTYYTLQNLVGTAFDGLLYYDADRLLAKPTPAGNHFSIYYTIDESFRTNEEFIVEAFTFRRSNKSYDWDRTPNRIRLEGSTNGTDWALLAENADAFPLVNNKSPVEYNIPSNDVEHLEYTVDVPHIRQANYRKYRFTMMGYTTVAPGIVAVHELFLKGRIVPSRTANPELTWNGGRTGGTWDATTANWLTPDGVATAWMPEARAYIDADDLTVDGTVSVGALRFPGGKAPVISGGTLHLAYPSTIDISHADLQISSAVTDAPQSGEDTTTSCARGTRDTAYTMLPRDETTTTTGKEVVWWRNRRLCDVSGVMSANIYYNGTWRGEGAVNDFTNDGERASCWFWRKYAQGSDATGEKIAWLAVKVEFRQDGLDITARLVTGGYKWLYVAEHGSDGSKIDFEHNQPSTAQVEDDTHHVVSGGSVYSVGLKDILLRTTTVPMGLLADNRSAISRLTDDRLPPDPNDNMTGVAVDYFQDMTLDEIAGFVGAGVHYGSGNGVQAWPFHFVRGEDYITVQFQRYDSTAVIGVKVEFRQNGPNVSARAVYAHYTWDDELGCDLDNKGGQPIAKANEGSGYNVSMIEPILATRKVTLSGPVSFQGDLETYALELRLAGAQVALPASTTGSGTLVFAPASGVTQTVTVGSPASSVPSVSVVGSTSLAFDEDATLSIGTLDLSNATAMTLPATLEANAFRVGTSNVLTKAELRKLAPSGKRALQDADGYVSLSDMPGLLLFFR